MSIAAGELLDALENPAETARANTSSDVERGEHGKWVKGCKSPNPSGRPRVLQNIQRMLDTEHRNLDAMRETFSRLRALALGEVVVVHHVSATGELTAELKLQADARYMQLYLDRLLGPATKPFDADDEDILTNLFADAPPEFIEFVRIRLGRK